MNVQLTSVFRLFLLQLISLILFASGSPALADDSPGEKLQIYTVNYPLAYFAERIAGDQADVVFPVPPDEDPAYWMPDAKTIARFQNADLILLNGAKYAKWTAKVSLPGSKMVDTSKSFKDHYIYTKAEVTHSHGPEGKHAHENLAFTTWLDLSFAVEQARAVAMAIERKKSSYRDAFRKNFASLEQDLLALDKKLAAIVLKQSGLPLVVSHPVYDYLGQRYHLNIKSVHWEPHEVPDHGQITQLKSILKDHPAAWMIWEGEPEDKSVAALDALGMGSIVFFPCSNRPDNADFLTIMHQNIEDLKKLYH